MTIFDKALDELNKVYLLALISKAECVVRWDISKHFPRKKKKAERALILIDLGLATMLDEVTNYDSTGGSNEHKR